MGEGNADLLHEKISWLKPKDEAWRTRLPELLKMQLEMEKKWNQMKNKDGFVMQEVNMSNIGDHAEDEADLVKIVVISDTHSLHKLESLTVPSGDILIHAGDFSNYGLVSEIVAFNDWLATLPHKHKIVVAGNHELSFDPGTLEESRYYMRQVGEDRDTTKSIADMKSLLTSCHYLEDQSLQLEGITFYGSPWQPIFSDSAFNLERGAALRRVWEKIPATTDVLITHSPPLGLGDKCLKFNMDGSLTSVGLSGCEDLVREVVTRVKPRYHVFGHVHEGYGAWTNGQTTFVNAATCDKAYDPINPPVMIKMARKKY